MTEPSQTQLTPESLRQLQAYVWQMNIDRGFSTEDAGKKLIMLMEELGELAKAIRKEVGLKFSESTEQKDIKEELADVQIVLLGLASISMWICWMRSERRKRKTAFAPGNKRASQEVANLTFLLAAMRATIAAAATNAPAIKLRATSVSSGGTSARGLRPASSQMKKYVNKNASATPIDATSRATRFLALLNTRKYATSAAAIAIKK